MCKEMEDRPEENPWKHKGRLKWVSLGDVVVAILGITYSTYRMFTFYVTLADPTLDDANVKKLAKDTHLAFYYFVWVVVILLYIFQMGCSYILMSAVDLDATETDPFDSVQKCRCWLRCSRVSLFVVVVKLCLEPFIAWLFFSLQTYNGIFLLISEIIFRFVAIFCVKRFMQELQ